MIERPMQSSQLRREFGRVDDRERCRCRHARGDGFAHRMEQILSVPLRLEIKQLLVNRMTLALPAGLPVKPCEQRERDDRKGGGGVKRSKFQRHTQSFDGPRLRLYTAYVENAES